MICRAGEAINKYADTRHKLVPTPLSDRSLYLNAMVRISTSKWNGIPLESLNRGRM